MTQPITLTQEQRSDLENYGKALADVFADPAAIAERLAAYAKKHLPERVSSALWITATGERDRGIEIEIRTVKVSERLRVQLGGLLGAVSAGLSLSTPVLTTPSVTVRAGVGAIVRFADLSKIEPVLVFTARF